jgi:hypothetical protein
LGDVLGKVASVRRAISQDALNEMSRPVKSVKNTCVV